MTTRTGVYSIIILLLAVAGQNSFAQTGSQSDWTPEQKQVWSGENSLWQGMLSENTTAWAQLWHEDYSGWPVVSDRPINRAEVIASRDRILKIVKAGTLSYNLNPLGINIHENVAIVHYTFNWTAELAGGGMVNGSGRCSRTWLGKNGTWKILSGAGMMTSFENVDVTDVVADADTRATELLNQLLVALKIEDGNSRVRAVVGLAHRSLLTKDGSDLDWNTKEYSYKKAFQNAHLYKYPAVVVRTSQKRDQVVGFAETAERGWVQTYYLEVNKGTAGMPAPVQIFFPASGDPPKVLQMSL